jgi:hypothetical protein
MRCVGWSAIYSEATHALFFVLECRRALETTVARPCDLRLYIKPLRSSTFGLCPIERGGGGHRFRVSNFQGGSCCLKFSLLKICRSHEVRLPLPEGPANDRRFSP